MFAASGVNFDEGRSQGVLAARDVAFGALRKRQPSLVLAPLTAHPAILGTSKHARFTVSTAASQPTC